MKRVVTSYPKAVVVYLRLEEEVEQEPPLSSTAIAWALTQTVFWMQI